MAVAPLAVIDLYISYLLVTGLTDPDSALARREFVWWGGWVVGVVLYLGANGFAWYYFADGKEWLEKRQNEHRKFVKQKEAAANSDQAE